MKPIYNSMKELAADLNVSYDIVRSKLMAGYEEGLEFVIIKNPVSDVRYRLTLFNSYQDILIGVRVA